MRTAVRRILVTATLATVLLLAGGWLLVGTEIGARWVLERATPASLQLSGVEGRLLGPLRIRSLLYRLDHQEAEISASGVELAWAPADLLSGTLTVRRLSVTRLRFSSGLPLLEGFRTIPRPEPVLRGLEQLLGRPIRVPLPVALRVDSLGVEHATVHTPDSPDTVEVGEISLRGRADRTGIELEHLRTDGRAVSATACASFRPGERAGAEVDARIRAEVRLPGRPEVDGRLDVTGSADSLGLRVVTTEPMRSRLQGIVRQLAADPTWFVQWTTGRLGAGELPPSSPLREAVLSLSAGGTLATAAGTLSLWAVPPSGPAVAGHVRARLAGDSVAIEEAVLQRSVGDASVQASGTLGMTAGVPRFRVDGSWQDLAWPVEGTPLAASPSGRFRAAGSPDSTHVTVDAQGRQNRVGTFRADLEAVLRPDAIHLRRLLLRPDGAPARIEARGTLRTGEEQPRIEAVARWTDLSWPLSAGPGAPRSPSGRLELDGTVDELSYRLDATVAPTDTSTYPVRASGRYGPESVSVDALRVELLDGSVEGSARVEIPSGRWSADLRARGLSPGTSGPLSASSQGRVSFRLRASGARSPAGIRASLRFDSVVGEMAGRSVDGFAHLAVDGDAVSADSLELRVGSARFRAEGGVGDRWDLDATLDAPDLGVFHPAVSGSGRAEISTSGPRSDPEVRARLASDSVVAEAGGEAFRLGRLEAEGRWRPSAGDVPELNLRARRLGAAGRHLDSVTAKLQKTETGSRVEFRAGAPAAEMRVSASGQLSDGAWTGTVDSLGLDSPSLGSWRLASPAPMALSRDSASLGRLCWQGAGARLCGDGRWARERGARWRITGDSLSLGLLAPWTPAPVELEGVLGLAVSGTVAPDGALRIRGDLRGEALTLRAPATGDTLARTADSLVVSGNVTPDSGSARLNLFLADGGRLAARARGVRSAGSWGHVEGRVEANLRDDGLAGAAIPALTSTDGLLRGELAFDGDWRRPALKGELALEKGQAGVVPAGLALRDIRLRVSDGGPGTLRLSGAVTSGRGSATLDGTLRLADDGGSPSLDLRVAGEDLEVQNTPAVRLVVSPDLRVVGTATGLTATGRVRIPEARIAPRRMEAPVRASADVVVVDREAITAPDTVRGRLPAPPVRADIEVELGDRVRVEGFGLRGRLTGAVRVSARPDEVPTGRGEIQIVQGRYLAFQRSLRIDNGRLLFSGTPVDDPGLDLTITRRTAGVEVGMTVGGTARSPRFVLFSTPAMSEADLLSYLLFGRPVAAVNRFEGAVLRDAVQGVGLMGGEALASQLGAALGLEESRLVTEGGRVTALDLGTSLSPRLTLGYSLGLFGSPSVLRIGYRIGRGWMIQAESGAEGGADVLYLIER